MVAEAENLIGKLKTGSEKRTAILVSCWGKRGIEESGDSGIWILEKG
jgi:hypothetical protein